jgi:hypothetical protein
MKLERLTQMMNNLEVEINAMSARIRKFGEGEVDMNYYNDHLLIWDKLKAERDILKGA